MRKRGPKSRYSEAHVLRALEVIRAGGTHARAAAYIGIAPSTFSEWLEAHPEFNERLKEAEGEAALEALNLIRKAAREGTWQAAAWLLERRYPSEFGRQVREHVGQDGGPMRFVVSTWPGSGPAGKDPESEKE